MSENRKLSKNEKIKVESRNLRGTLTEALDNDEPAIDKNNTNVLKFHGIYQQDDRDIRKIKGRDKEYSFMIRSRIAGGGLSWDQYLAHDELADQYGNGTIRLTTRQTIQLHGVIKHDLRKTLQDLHNKLIVSIGACGDIVRNINCCPAPGRNELDNQIRDFASELSHKLIPESRAYHEIFLEGEKVLSGEEEPEHEPLYGKTYLPRKFKIGIAWPGDNCIDVLTHDVGLIASPDENNAITGYTFVVGGGMGMNHKKSETFPRLADPLAWVPAEKALDVVKEIVAIQRDYGNREDRKVARFKYLIEEWGIPKFKEELENRLGYELDPPEEVIDDLEPELHLGWQQQADDRWFVGLSIENGRIKDTEEIKLKTGLRDIISKFRPDIRFTASQDILLVNIPEEQKPAIDAAIRSYGIPHEETLSNARKYSMACPAMPTCGLAIAESERVFPDVIRDLEQVLHQLGLDEEVLSFRMTGCPNGCARPYVADIGFVGRSLDSYTVFVGGGPDGKRLNQVYKDLVPLDKLVETVTPLFEQFRDQRQEGESFSDFITRVGIENLEEEKYE